jgi:hypothetical protein
MGIPLISCNPIPPSQECWARGFVSVFLITSTTLIKGYSVSYQRPHVQCCPSVLRVKIGPLEESYLWEAGNCWFITNVGAIPILALMARARIIRLEVTGYLNAHR